jgi:hypothetical protein
MKIQHQIRRIAVAAVAITAVVFVSGCGKDILDGPIPECQLLISDSKIEYVKTAIERCDQARTFEEKMKSVGCAIKDRHHLCKMLNPTKKLDRSRTVIEDRPK